MKKFLILLCTLFVLQETASGMLLKAHDNTGETPLHFAARNGNLEAAQFFLKQYPSMVEKKDLFGKTPLFAALSHGHIAIVELLMRSRQGQKTKIEPVANETACGANPLHIMISLKQPHDRVRRILDWVENHPVVFGIKTQYIIDVNGTDKNGRTPLDIAYAQGDQELMKVLIAAKNIDVNKRNSDGHTLLFIALTNKDLRHAELLLDAHTANTIRVNGPSVRDSEERTPVHIFAQNGDLEGIQSILNWNRAQDIPDLAIDTVDHENKTPLHLAVTNNKPRVTAFLATRSSASILNIIDSRGRTLLFIALAYGYIEIANILYKAKVLTELSENPKDTPINILAAEIGLAHGFLDIESILFKLNTGKELKDRCKITPLHILAAKNEFSQLESVIEWMRTRMPFEIDAQDYQMRTPLFVALLHGSTQAASLLLEHGANPYERPNNQGTPLHYLAYKNEPQSLERVIRWSRSHQLDYTGCQDSEGSTALMLAVVKGSLGLVAKFILPLLDKREVLELKNEEGKTALFLALSLGYIDIADLLINMGASASELKDLEGRNPLHYLVENKDVDGLERVLNWQQTKQLAYIDICECDDHGASPLNFAAFQPSDEYAPLIKKLVEHGAIKELPPSWHSCIERDAREGKLTEARQTLLTAYLAVMIAQQHREE